jgi:uncharacterized protein
MLPGMRTDVHFPGFGGVSLRGWLYTPEGAASSTAAPVSSPALVMAHGFSATRHMGLAGYADVFCAAGYAVLVYDHRGFGDSDGEPRQEVNPWAQARDYRYALSWLARQPGIDAARLGVWGSSFSGGEVLVVGAVDGRVKVVIANVPSARFPADVSPAGRAERFAVMRAALEDESGAGPADRIDPAIGPMPVVRATGGDRQAPVFLSQPESTAWFEEAGGEGSGWQNTCTLRGLGGEPAFDPAATVPFIAPRPLLMVVATGDRVAPQEIARAAFEIAGEPKQLELVEGDHYQPYSGATFGRCSLVMRDFLLSHL